MKTRGSGQQVAHGFVEILTLFGPGGEGALVEELAVLLQEVDHQRGGQQLKGADELGGGYARVGREASGDGGGHEVAHFRHGFRFLKVGADKALEFVHQRDESTVSRLCGHEGQLLPPRRRVLRGRVGEWAAR
jgi:hypothetical protein